MIRHARSDDYAAFVALFRELGIDDPIPTPEYWRDTLAPEALVVERDGAVVGVTTYYRLARAGHVRHLAVDPGARRRGVASELMTGVSDEFRAAGVDEWHLNVKDDNTAAIQLYERFGMAVEYRTVVVAITWDIARHLVPSTASVTSVEPSDDDDVERALDLVAGRIAMLRKRGVLLFVARDGSLAPVGLSAFTPSLPGAYPFRATSYPHAVALLHAMARHRLPHLDKVQLVIENHDELAQQLIAEGAIAKLRLRHYVGSL